MNIIHGETMKRAASNACMFVAALLVSLGFLEAVLHVLYESSLITSKLYCEEPPVDRARQHPYIGYYYDQKIQNNEFAYIPDFTQKDDSELVIGVFGGSVAEHFGTGRLSGTTFEKLIQPHITKKVKVVNYARGGYKQPQSLIALTYAMSLGHRFDYVLMIDGYNDAVFSFFNEQVGMPFQYPAYQLLVPFIARTGTQEKNKKFVEGYKGLEAYVGLRRTLCYFGGRTRSSLLRFAANAADNILGRQVQKQSAKMLVATGMVDVHDSEYYVENTVAGEPWKKCGAMWRNSVVLMEKLVKLQDGTMMNFIQPNQHFTKHQFSDAERAIAFSPLIFHGEFVAKGYEEILRQAVKLQKDGYKIVSTVDMFDDTNSQVYGDNCCHYNEYGEKLFQERILNSVLNEMASNNPDLLVGR